MKLPILVFIAAGASACAAGPGYQRPEREAPKDWSEAQGELVAAEPARLESWWTAFGDPTLDSLVQRACAANLDLKLAAARVREARAQAGITRADLLPRLDANGSVTRNRYSENGAFPVADPQANLYSAGFDAHWELDVFGGTRRSIEAAQAEIEASVEDRRAVLVSLLGEVARAYIELRGNQQLAAVSRRNVEAANATLEITRARLDGGMATALDVSRAEALLANARAPLPQFETAVRVNMHRLAILLAQPPASLARELEVAAPVPRAPQRLLVGLPAELLARRPDVRFAERRLAASTARIGMAISDRYPKFSLSSAFGLESANSSDFADAASRAWSIGPSVRWPIFAGGRIEANIEVQDARTEQALHTYDRALLTALEEVENAIVSYLREWDHHRALEAAAVAQRQSVTLADDLFRKGLTSFLDVLDAERSLYDAELQLTQSETATALDVVTLYKALGGGWQSLDGPESKSEQQADAHRRTATNETNAQNQGT